MTIDYKALAERIRQELDKPYYTGSTTMIHKDDLRTVASLLEGMADEKPVLWMQSDHVGIASRSPFMARCAPTQLHPDFVPLFTHPAPQPPPERQPVTYETLLGAVARGWCHPENANKEMDAALAAAIANEVMELLLHPQPAQPQPERQPVSEQLAHEIWSSAQLAPGEGIEDGVERIAALLGGALNEPTKAQIEARDALLDFISENGPASEGVLHYLDRYVRAARGEQEKNSGSR